jgi:adenosylhomocysteine nucleosidase
MSRVAIVSAMHEEQRALLPLLGGGRSERRAARDFHLGRLGAHDAVCVLCGIGKVAAATTATLLIERYGVQRIIFTGVAGGLGRGVRVGDVVVASELLQHDMDASPIFPRHEVPLTGLKRFIADAALSEALAQAVQHVIADPAPSFAVHGAALGIDACALHRGLVVSGDRFVSTAAESAALRAELPDALAVEMEGAALAQVCHAFGVPFAVLRTISDRADDSAHIDFTRFIDEVASRMSAAIVAAWADPRVC